MQRANRRQLALFVAVIVLPCLVLIGLSMQLARQERELEEKRRADERAGLLADFRTGLAARLEAIRSNETAAGLEPGGRYRHPEVVFVAWIEDGKLVLPWEADEAARRAQALLSDAALQDCEQLEAAPRQAGPAARCYKGLLAGLRNPLQAAYARLQLAGALHAAGRQSEANDLYGEVAAAAPGLTDPDGVPLCLLAAQRLSLSGPERLLVLKSAKAALESRPWTGPPACQLLREISDVLPLELRAAVAGRVQMVRQAQSLQDDFDRLGIARRNGRNWTAYGEEPWVVSVKDDGSGRPVVTVVRVRDAAVPLQARLGVRIAAPNETGGEWAGDSLPGLRVFLPVSDASPLSRAGDVQRRLFFYAVFLVLAAAAFAAWLLWRDMRRELLLADLRAQFVASVSHELKTPLTAIRMFAETLQMKRSRDPETEAEYLDTIVGECERLSRLVDGVLLFAKTEQGKKVYHFRPLRLENVVRAAVRAMQYPLDRQGFRLNAQVDEDIPEVKGDADALEQALLNLLGNAMKYSGESRDIEVELSRENGDAILRVTDHGVGIAPEAQPRIFDKFYRAPTRENELTPGTGLGLALVAQIVKAHGGRVDVRSAVGKGSAFSIRLPLEEKT